MNLYTHFDSTSIRIKYNEEERIISFNASFYSKRNDGLYQMFFDEKANVSIEEFINRHWRKLNLLQKIKYRLFRNNVYVLIDETIESQVNIDQLYSYAMAILHARNVYLIKEDPIIDKEDLTKLKEYKKQYINGRFDAYIPVAEIKK